MFLRRGKGLGQSVSPSDFDFQPRSCPLLRSTSDSGPGMAPRLALALAGSSYLALAPGSGSGSGWLWLWPGLLLLLKEEGGDSPEECGFHAPRYRAGVVWLPRPPPPGKSCNC